MTVCSLEGKHTLSGSTSMSSVGGIIDTVLAMYVGSEQASLNTKEETRLQCGISFGRYPTSGPASPPVDFCRQGSDAEWVLDRAGAVGAMPDKSAQMVIETEKKTLFN